MSFFFFYKIREKEAEHILWRGVGTSGRREEVEKGCRRVNVV
jgi:hypothetical protein